MSNHNQGWLRREERRLTAAATPAEPAAASTPESQPVQPAEASAQPAQQPVAPQPEQARPSMEQWPALHPQEPLQDPSQEPPQQPPQEQPVPGQQYPQFQPPPQRTHSDHPYAAPYRYEHGVAPREEGPQR